MARDAPDEVTPIDVIVSSINADAAATSTAPPMVDTKIPDNTISSSTSATPSSNASVTEDETTVQGDTSFSSWFFGRLRL